MLQKKISRPSKETDRSVRSLLGARGMKKGDFSKFIEDAVRRRVFHRTVQDIKSRNTDKDPELLQQIIDETIKELRGEKRLKHRV